MPGGNKTFMRPYSRVYATVNLDAVVSNMKAMREALPASTAIMGVVKADGSTPGIGSYLLRWLLFPIDGPVTGGLGLLVVLLTKNSQRMGDLAAGTMVIKEKNYRKIHVSLDEFDYLTKDYRPTYPQASDLSLEQINVITRTLQSGKKDRTRRIASLAKKVQELLSITPHDSNPENFLQTILRDYQYYALEEI